MTVPVYIATTLPTSGETGVHTHFAAVRAHFESVGQRVQVLTPYDTLETLRRSAGLVWRALMLVSTEWAWRFRDGFYARLLRIRMRQVLKRDSPWTVYAQCPASALAALRFKERADQQIVMATHFNGSHADEMVESGLIRVGGGFYQSIQADERRALLHTDRLVFVSRFMRDVLRSTVPRLKERPALVVPNFIEIPAAPPDEKFAGDLASIGTLEPRKNQVFLLHVLAAARQKGFRYTLTLFGAGAPESSWRRVAQDLGIADQVVFAGFVPQASRYLHRFRAYVHGSKIESFGISLVEALACGLPVFAARAGGMPEVIDEGVTGFFWDLGSAEDAADMLIRVLEDEPLLESMSRGARAAYSTRFSADRIAPRLEAWVTRGIDLGDPSSAASITWSALASDQRERFNLAGNGHRER